MESILKIQNLTIGYDSVPLLQNININCQKGEIVLLCGPNGTGKSCLFKTLMGIIPSIKGNILFNFDDITSLSLLQRRKLGINLSPEGRNIFPNLTVEENLKVGMAIKGLFVNNQKQKISEVYFKFPKLLDRKNQLGGTLSGGEQQLLALARATIVYPKLLLLDEPTLGLSNFIINDIIEIISDLASSGITIMLADQNYQLYAKFTNRIIHLNEKQFEI
jgi:branched-chain amino acid transport system ATP-binding protein